jgi:protoheme ferro-lyase
LEGKRATMGAEPDGAITWSVIDRWPVHSGLIEAFAKNVEAITCYLSGREPEGCSPVILRA